MPLFQKKPLFQAKPLFDRPVHAPHHLDPDAVLDAAAGRPPSDHAITIGESREGRPILGYRAGHGPHPVSLIAGCHADEPIGPAMLDRLAAWLLALPSEHPLSTTFRFRLVPHVDPDGDAANAGWIQPLGEPERWPRHASRVTLDLFGYLSHVVRALPGDDLEFGFPRGPDDDGARPEARAVARFLAEDDGPYVLHGSFHGMALAAGPWFLIDRAWIDRSLPMRDHLRSLVDASEYVCHDIDRYGDKGFTRIDRGFTTRPDSRAMIRHFTALGDSTTAARFRPSSMEYVRHLGGDPLTIVSEMPLFTMPPAIWEVENVVNPPAFSELAAARRAGPSALAEAIERLDVRPMPIRDQMTFQLRFLDEALACALADASPSD